MHVLFDARLLHRPLSGLERVQRNLLRELSVHPAITRLRVVVMHGTRLPEQFPKNAEVVFVHGTEDILRELTGKDAPDVYHLTWFPDRNPRDLWLPLMAKSSGRSAPASVARTAASDRAFAVSVPPMPPTSESSPVAASWTRAATSSVMP